MKISVTNNYKYIDEVVEIHVRTFQGFFLSFLGRGFLKTLYKGFIDHPKSGLIVALDKGRVIGFCAYSEELSTFYKYLLMKKLPQFAWYALGAFIRKPQILFRLLRAFTYSSESKREESYIELSSIGVLPEAKNEGVGSKLIQKLCNMADPDKFEYIKLETDRDNNEGANHFYQKNGCVFDHTYETPEQRYMNEYRYYLGRDENEKCGNCNFSSSIRG